MPQQYLQLWDGDELVLAHGIRLVPSGEQWVVAPLILSEDVVRARSIGVWITLQLWVGDTCVFESRFVTSSENVWYCGVETVRTGDAGIPGTPVCEDEWDVAFTAADRATEYVDIEVLLDCRASELRMRMDSQVRDSSLWWWYRATDILPVLYYIHGLPRPPERLWRRLREWRTMRSVVLYWEELTRYQMAVGGTAYRRDVAQFAREEW